MASFSRSPSFVGPTITGGPPSNAGSAAGNVNLGNTFGSLRKNGPRFDELAATAIANRAQERATVTAVEGETAAKGVSAFGRAYANKQLSLATQDAYGEMKSAQNTASTLGVLGNVGGMLLGLSDETTKNNVERIDDALAKLRSLKPVTFHYKEEFSTSPERMHHGFIAQDFQEVMPDATYYDEEAGKLCIDTGDLIGLLVRAIQQLESRVTRMEAINALAGVK